MTQGELTWGSNDKGHRAAVLELLQDGKPHSTLEVHRVGGLRAPARIFELRNQGWDIICSGEKGSFVYQLRGRLTEPAVHRSWKRRALAAEAKLRELGAL